ncbi:protein of unknown function [Streptococcus thermophilus]|nr:protein of unknown function [Streptococcus thermophilus]
MLKKHCFQCKGCKRVIISNLARQKITQRLTEKGIICPS